METLLDALREALRLLIDLDPAPVSYTHLRYLEQFDRFAHDLERFVNDAFAANFHLPD